jgi:hypothetical protein
MGFVGALALAAGLAFGLGGRETAAKIVEDWYERVQESKPEIERAARVGSDMAERKAVEMRSGNGGPQRPRGPNPPLK